MADILFTPLQVGAVRVPNRIFMAPLTRLRSIEPGDIPTALMAEHYRQRATAGLIIAEATHVSFQSKGYAGAPGLHTPEQIAAWKVITAAVHADGGRIATQLWHSGRISHNSVQPGGRAPVAPSAINADSSTTLRDANGRPVRVSTSTPRALTKAEIADVVQDFRQAVVNAREANFDLVELHGAHGYLIHEFLSPVSNQRDDEYGGSIENRTRFCLEVVDAAIDAWQADRIGIRISPLGNMNGLDNGDDQETAALYLLKQLAKRNLAFLHFSEHDWRNAKPYKESFRRQTRDAYPGVIIGAGAYTKEKAEELIRKGLIDAVAFGRNYIANPDLVARLKQDAPLNVLQMETLFGGGAEGYTDYPTLDTIPRENGGSA